jgi:hypothetical protein
LSRRLSNRGLGLLGLFADRCRGFFGLRSLSLLCGLLDGRSGSDCLGGGFSLCRCKLLVDLVEILLTLRNVVVLVERRVLGLSGGRGRLLGAIGRCRGLVELFLLLGLLSKVTENVVQYEVAVGLLREDECLGEALVGIALVGDLADDLNDDVGFRALGVDVGDANLGVLEVVVLDALIDCLLSSASIRLRDTATAIPFVQRKR